jgi:hypothetical protein
MVTTTMIAPQVQWVTASPLWGELAADPDQMRRPALLRFASDSFMQDLSAVLQSPDAKLSDYIATYESFAAPLPGATPAPPPTSQVLKLYQPIHGHFYLVTASLVCRMLGLPDKVVDAANRERVSFVLRRLRDSDSAELAWVPNPTGPGKQWLPTPAASEVADGEELLPMFPVNFRENGSRRRLIVGLIPTSSRESYQAAVVTGESLVAPTETDPGIGQTTDQRYVEFDTKVLGALRGLRDAIENAKTAGLKTQLSTEAQEAFLFMLLDFSDFLSQYMPGLWDVVQGKASSTTLAPNSQALLTRLQTPIIPGLASWQTALNAAWTESTNITAEPPGPVTESYDLTSLSKSNPSDSTLTTFGKLVNAALGDYPLPAQPQSGSGTPATTGTSARGAGQQAAPADVPKLDPRASTQYVLRCVYQRPNCGPLHPDLVSAPSVPFTIAPYFDFDAPARPLRITMPVDTSIAGLRKFNKNVAFLISKQLRQQMGRVTDLKSLMDGQLADEQTLDLGVICSFSIPIITICALLLLLIIVSLLNIVFWWLALFRICLPIRLK